MIVALLIVVMVLAVICPAILSGRISEQERKRGMDV